MLLDEKCDDNDNGEEVEEEEQAFLSPFADEGKDGPRRNRGSICGDGGMVM